MSDNIRNQIPLFQRLEIETQANCNRICWFCPRIYDRSGVYLNQNGKAVLAKMPTEKVLDLLDQAQSLGFRGQVTFYFYSEPLLDKRNLRFAREARIREMKTYLHTNGDVLKNNEALCEQVCEAYDRIVIGLYDYKNEEELNREIDLWRGKLHSKNLEFSRIGLDGRKSGRSMAIPRALVPTDSRMGIPDLVYKNTPCNRPLIRMIVRYDGQICNCCEDVLGEFELGNVFDRSLEDLWYSDKHVHILEDLVAGRREDYSLCRNCPASPSSMPVEGTEIKIRPRHFTP